MIKDEWKNLFKNKLMIVVLIAIILIPSIYTTFFLGSMWDPYGKLDNLPVAVVNEDKAVKFNGTTLHVGKDLAKNLEKNDSLRFEVTNKANAKNGLNGKDYYMMIVIPKDFSKNATTVLDKSPKKMELQYYTTPGKNYIAAKMSESAMSKLKAKVSSNVTQTYAKVIASSITTAANGMDKAANASGQLANGANTAKQGSQTITTNLNKLTSGSLTFKNGAETLTVGLKKYTNAVTTAMQGANKLANGSAQLNAGSQQLAAGINQYTNGTTQYVDAVNKYTNGVDAIQSGSKQLSALSQLGQISTGVTQISNAINGQSGSLKQGTTSLAAGLKQIDDQVNALKNSDMNSQLQSLNTAVTGTKTIVTKSKTGIDQAQNGLGQISTSLTALSSQVGTMADTFAGAANKQIAAQNAASNAKIDQAIATVKASSMSDEEKQNVVNSLNNAKVNTTVDLSAVANAYKEKLGAASTQLTTASASMKTLSDALTNADGYLTQIETGLASSKAIDTDMINKLAGALDTAYAGAVKVDQGVGSLGTAVDTLEASTNKLPKAAAGYSSLSAGIDKLQENNKALVNAGTKLTGSAKTLNAGASSAVSGMKQLNTGVHSLQSGLKAIQANNKTLNNGSAKLSSAAGTIANGSSQLASGSATLTSGLSKIEDGNGQLASSLATGANTMKKANLKTANQKMIAAPVAGKETKVHNIKNNGYAMAAYMLNVGMWVGCIAFTIMYPLIKRNGKVKNGLSWWLGKATIAYPISIAMAFVMVGILHAVLGFTPANMGQTLLLASVTGITYMSILYFFNALIGKVGSFVMLVFTVIQLGGSAGTYPLEISGRFVNMVHPYLPFSYAVDAYRKVISGAGSISFDLSILLIIAGVFTVLTIMLFSYRDVRIKAGKPVLSTFIEEKGF